MVALTCIVQRIYWYIPDQWLSHTAEHSTNKESDAPGESLVEHMALQRPLLAPGRWMSRLWIGDSKAHHCPSWTHEANAGFETVVC